MVNTKNKLTEDLINQFQQLKGKTKLKFYQNISNYFDKRNFRRQSDTFQFEQDPFSKHVEGIGKSFHEVLLLVNFLQSKPQDKILNNNFYDLYYTVIENRNEIETLNDDEYENDFINFDDFTTLHHYIGQKKIIWFWGRQKWDLRWIIQNKSYYI